MRYALHYTLTASQNKLKLSAFTKQNFLKKETYFLFNDKTVLTVKKLIKEQHQNNGRKDFTEATDPKEKEKELVF